MAVFEGGEVPIFYREAGDGPPILFLHGFPQTHALWDDVIADISRDFTCIAADLRGYGASGKPDPTDLAAYGFRAMASDMLALMTALGHERFHVVGHDRGARVAHRMALDAGERLTSLTLMDIVPTRHLLENWSLPVAKAYWHWTYLAQPAPFAERMIEADPDHFFHTCLMGWGGAQPSDFARLDAYRAAWRDPATIAGMVADYRATPVVDFKDDRVDAGRKVDLPALVLWGADGVMARLYDVAAIWGDYLSDYDSGSIPGGHFFIDTAPDPTTARLRAFLSRL